MDHDAVKSNRTVGNSHLKGGKSSAAYIDIIVIRASVHMGIAQMFPAAHAAASNLSVQHWPYRQ